MYRKTLLTSIFAELSIDEKKPRPRKTLVQPLRGLTAETLAPVAADSRTDPEMPATYTRLWGEFVAGHSDLVVPVGDDVEELHRGLLSLSERFTWSMFRERGPAFAKRTCSSY